MQELCKQSEINKICSFAPCSSIEAFLPLFEKLGEQIATNPFRFGIGKVIWNDFRTRYCIPFANAKNAVLSYLLKAMSYPP